MENCLHRVLLNGQSRKPTRRGLITKLNKWGGRKETPLLAPLSPTPCSHDNLAFTNPAKGGAQGSSQGCAFWWQDGGFALNSEMLPCLSSCLSWKRERRYWMELCSRRSPGGGGLIWRDRGFLVQRRVWVTVAPLEECWGLRPRRWRQGGPPAPWGTQIKKVGGSGEGVGGGGEESELGWSKVAFPGLGPGEGRLQNVFRKLLPSSC